MRRNKSFGTKAWNKGWRHRDRKTLNRCIEKSFRQDGKRDVRDRVREEEAPLGA